MGITGPVIDRTPHCPRCGGAMHSTGSQYWCGDDLCEVACIRITTKAAWIEKRARHEAERQTELQAATKTGDSYPPAIQI